MGKYLYIKFKQVVFSSKQMHSMCVFIVESSKVLYKLLDILKFDNIVELSTSVLAHKIFNKSSSIPSLFYDSLRAASNLHKYNTRYPSTKSKDNTGKFTFAYLASKLKGKQYQQTWNGSLLSSEFQTKIYFVIISIIVFWLIWKL